MDIFPVLAGAVIALLACATGAAILAGGIFLGAYLARANRQSGPRTNLRRHERTSVDQPQPSAILNSVAAAVARQPEAPPSPPPADGRVKQIAMLHTRAVTAYRRGEHERAMHYLDRAIDENRTVDNPWLDEELVLEYCSLLCALSQFDRAEHAAEFVREKRERLGDAPRSNYLSDRIGDLRWMLVQHEKDLEGSQEAFILHKQCADALERGDKEEAARFAREAIASAELTARDDHWIMAVMLNGMAQVCYESDDIHGASYYWDKADILLSDWPGVLPGLAYAIKHNLKMCEGHGEGEEWKS